MMFKSILLIDHSRAVLMAAVVGAALFLSACATPQDYAGINHVDYTTPDGRNVVVYLGKESETFEAKVVTPDGIDLWISASGVRAFEGQQARAQLKAVLYQTLAGFGIEVTDNIVEALTTGVMGSLGLPVGPSP